MDSRNTAFENYWATQWFDFDDTETTERRRRIAKVAFDAGWSAALTDDVQDSIRATARAEALKEAAERFECKWGEGLSNREIKRVKQIIMEDENE